MADEPMPVEAEPEVVDGVVVRDEPGRALERRSVAPLTVQAAAVAGASLVAGATAVVLARGVARVARSPRRARLRLGGRRRGGRLDIVATRTFLVDVHLVDRR
ncbi:MAG: hypothetical protein IRZ32_11910 [Solirubrobacteraceae bacterium]|nr:hypothetical protein [Solirubrobacteraceae bacterium]